MDGASWVVVRGGQVRAGDRMGAGGHRGIRGKCGGQAYCCLPQPVPLPRLDLSNCSLHSVPPGLAEAAAAIVL